MKSFSLIAYLLISNLAYSQLPINDFILNKPGYQVDSQRRLPCRSINKDSKITINFQYVGTTPGSRFDIGYYMEANPDNKVGVDTIGYNSGTLNYSTVLLTDTRDIVFFAHCDNCNATSPKFTISQININIECFSPLPIELITFEANNELKQNTINWETASETNNDYFTIEHSSDGYSWNIIDKIDGAGNSNTAINYSIEHRDYPNSINYYQLSQTDYDGRSETFPIVSIDNSLHKNVVRKFNTLGQKVGDNYHGMVIELNSDNTSIKKVYH
ncbi:MAG TPA: hypothetical protein VKY37_00630 [Brumimicrobium sp.]|nr:hypothetical protein [Brumimicrobium sp.]